MRSYKPYVVLVFLPYLFLICMFHVQLQLYDRTGTHPRSESELQEALSLDMATYRVRELMLQNHSKDVPVKQWEGDTEAVKNGAVLRKPQLNPSSSQNTDNLTEQEYRGTKNMLGAPNQSGPTGQGDPSHRTQHDNVKYKVGNPVSNDFVDNSRSFQSDETSEDHVPTRFELPFASPCRRPNTHVKAIQFQNIFGNYIYSAYYDNRNAGPAYVRVITLLKKSSKPALYCHFPVASHGRHGNKTYVTSMMKYYEMCENHAKEHGGWILSCKVPQQTTPNPPCQVIVSVYSRHWPHFEGGTVTVPVFTTEPDRPHVKKAEFGICVPPLFGYIPSTTLIEFIEMTKLLGAQHFMFYAYQVSREISRVLRHYKNAGLVTVIPWNIPVVQKNVWYHGQLVAINDCLYRGMSQYHYLAFNDIDEYIVPHKHKHWSAMIQYLQHESAAHPARHSGYSFQSAFFDPLLSTSTHALYDLESDLRTKIFSRVRTKVMVNPANIFELGIHHISKAVEDKYVVIGVEPNVAFLHHYRKCVVDFDPRMNCQIFARDESVSRYIPTLRHNVHSAMWTLRNESMRDPSNSYVIRTR